MLLKYRRIVGLGELASDLTMFAKQLRALRELLRDSKRCAFVAVARAAELPRLETDRLVARISELEITPAAIIANAVTTDPTCATCEAIAEHERGELARLAAIARHAGAPLVVAPAIYPAPHGITSLAAWRATWRV
jgi:anion-transporting  ArsA/GET3 family ATPase